MSSDNLPQETHGERAVATEDPIADPGLPAHESRPTDVDPRAERRAERQVAALFGLALLGSIGFIVSYLVFQVGDDPDIIANLGASNLMLGLCLTVTLLGMGAGMIQWARKLMGDHEIVEMRHTASSSPEDREAAVAILQTGLEESGLARRPLIRNSLPAAGGVLGLLPVIMLRDLGPLPGDKLDHTMWDLDTWTPEMQSWWQTQNRSLQRVVRDVVGTPIKVTDLEVGDLVNAEPEVMFAVDDTTQSRWSGHRPARGEVRGRGHLHGSCPPTSCPRRRATGRWTASSATRRSARTLVPDLVERAHHPPPSLPVHQSTFDLADSGRVLFGRRPGHFPA